MEWTWSRTLAMSSGVLGVFFNVLLIPIILLRSSKHIGSYKYLLLLYTVDAAFYSLTQVRTLPTFYVSDLGLLFFQQLPLLSRLPGTVVIFTFVFTHAMVVLVLTLCFIYRYLVMKNPEALCWFQKPLKFAVVFGSTILTASYLVFTAIFALWPSEEADGIFKEAAFKNTGRNITEMAYIGAAVIVKGRTNPRMQVCMWSFAAMVVTCTNIIIFCIIGVVKSLRRSIGMVKKTHQYHKRLFALLMTQTLLPFTFTFTPPLAAWLLALFQITIGDIITVFGDIMTVAQVIDPLLVFYFIAEYRNALINYILRRPMNSSSVGTMAPESRYRSNNTVSGI